MDNSFKYTKEGIIKFEVNSIEKGSQVCSIEFKISDTGLGMSEEKLNNLQSINTRADGLEKSALGIFIVKKLLLLMHGKYEVQSVLGKGTETTITIPFNISQTREVDRDLVLLEKIDFDKARGRKIIVAEDSGIMQQVVLGLLKLFFDSVKIVANGAELIEEVTKQNEYDLIIADIVMPEVSGDQAIRELVRIGVKTPMVAMTTSISDMEISRLRHDGFDEVIKKPLIKHDVEKIIYKYLNK